MSKMTDNEKKIWFDMCDYIKYEILEYSKDMKFPKHLALRLKGLNEGNFIAKKCINPQANYTFDDIWLTFKIHKYDILNAFKSKEFKNENNKINYMMVIIESNINEVVLRRSKIEKSKEKTKNIDVIENNGAEYKKKTEETKNERLKDLW